MRSEVKVRLNITSEAKSNFMIVLSCTIKNENENHGSSKNQSQKMTHNKKNEHPSKHKNN